MTACDGGCGCVPFTHKPEKVDQELKEKLKAEYPAILRWAIDGCLDWQKMAS